MTCLTSRSQHCFHAWPCIVPPPCIEFLLIMYTSIRSTEACKLASRNSHCELHAARGGVPASALGATSDPGTVALTCWSPRRTPADLALLGKDDAAALMKFMNDQLDTFGPEHLLLGRYQLLGPNERRAGGTHPTPPFPSPTPTLPIRMIFLFCFSVLTFHMKAAGKRTAMLYCRLSNTTQKRRETPCLR